MKKEETLKAHLMIVAGLLIFFLITKNPLFAYISLGLSLVSLFIPPVGMWIAIGWTKLTELLGAINSRILLSLIFFLVLLPVAFISRLFRKDAMQIKRSATGSLYSVRNHIYTGDDLKNVW